MKRTIFQSALIVCLTMLVSFPVIKYGWYIQDDYLTLGFSKSKNLFESAENITKWLSDSQNRYQPVRLGLFAFFGLAFREESVLIFNLILHSFNVLLGFLLLNRIGARISLSIVATVLFGCASTWRMLESPSTMLGGDGLVFFLVISSSLLLSYSYYSLNSAIKCVSYLFAFILYGLSFLSYESSYPLLVVPLVVLLFSNPSRRKENVKLKKLLIYIFPLFLLGLVGLAIRIKQGSSYEGASVDITWDILTRLYYYTERIFKFGLLIKTNPYENYKVVIPSIAAILFALIVTIDYKKEGRYGNLVYLILGLLLYLSSVSLFVINHWQTPKDVMVHHLYIPTFFASIIIAGLFDIIQYYFSYKFWKFSAALFLITFCTLAYNSLTLTYKDVFKYAGFLKQVRDELIDKYDGSNNVIIIGFNNYRDRWHPLMSGMDGALSAWLRNGYVKNGTDGHIDGSKALIRYKYPLTYYQESSESRTADLGDSQIYELGADGLQVVKNSFFLKNSSNTGKNNILCDRSEDSVTLDSKYIYAAGKTYLLIDHDPGLDFFKNFEIKINGDVPKKILFIERGKVGFKIPAGFKYIKVDVYRTGNASSKSMIFYTDNTNIVPKKEYIYSPRMLDVPYAVLQKIEFSYSRGFYAQENIPERGWRWSDSYSKITITNNNPKSKIAKFRFGLAAASADIGKLTIHGVYNGSLAYSNVEKIHEIDVDLKHGENNLYFHSDLSVMVNGDSRNLSFSISNACLVGLVDK